MILVGIGSNLSDARHATPRAACEAAIAELERRGVHVAGRSPWFRSAPVPPSDQPWYVNGVLRVETGLAPRALLERLHDAEAAFGRVRRVRNEARILDLDLLAYDDLVLDGPEGPILPHPRLHERAFVLLPLAALAPDWRHPRLGRPLAELVARLPRDQAIEPVPEEDASPRA